MEENKKKSFWKKQGSNIIFILVIALFLIPQTRKPIQVQLNRLFAFSPSEISEEKQELLSDYNWNLVSLSGERTNFTQAKGKVAIVNFWATWCPPCIAEMPSFQEVYNDYGAEVEFYFVSSEEQGKLSRFLEKENYNLPVYSPLSAPPVQMQSNSLPITYVISKDGDIIVEKTGAADWNSKGFRELLDGLLK